VAPSHPNLGDDDDDIPTDVHVIKVHLKRVISDHAHTDARIDEAHGHILRIEGKVDTMITKIDTSIRTAKTVAWVAGGAFSVFVALGGAIVWALAHLALKP
jgi:hypothetical protein